MITGFSLWSYVACYSFLCMMLSCVPTDNVAFRMYPNHITKHASYRGNSRSLPNSSNTQPRFADQRTHRTTILATGPRRGYRERRTTTEGHASASHLMFAGYHEPPPSQSLGSSLTWSDDAHHVNKTAFMITLSCRHRCHIAPVRNKCMC